MIPTRQKLAPLPSRCTRLPELFLHLGARRVEASPGQSQSSGRLTTEQHPRSHVTDDSSSFRVHASILFRRRNLWRSSSRSFNYKNKIHDTVSVAWILCATSFVLKFRFLREVEVRYGRSGEVEWRNKPNKTQRERERDRWKDDRIKTYTERGLLQSWISIEPW